MALLSGLVLASSCLLFQDGEAPAAEDSALLQQQVERQQLELDRLRERLDRVENERVDGQRGRSGESLLDDLRINVYSNILGQADDQPVLNDEGEEIHDSVRVRKTDFDFRAPLGRHADGVLIATLEGDTAEDYDSDLEEGFARLRLFDESAWPLTLKGGQFRSRFGRNNRLRVFELPEPTRPLVVANYLGDDGYLATGASVMLGVPTGSARHELSVTYEGTNSGDLRVGYDPGDEPVAHLLDLDWSWEASATLTILGGLSGYSSRGDHDRLGGANLLFFWQTDGPSPRAYTLGAEALLADPDEGDDAFGAYAWGQAELFTGVFAGVRYDHLEPLSDPDSQVEQVGGYVTWFFTRRLRLSAGYEHSFEDVSTEESSNHVYGEVSVFLGPDPLVPFWAGDHP